jgi:hypothetical protein
MCGIEVAQATVAYILVYYLFSTGLTGSEIIQGTEC